MKEYWQELLFDCRLDYELSLDYLCSTALNRARCILIMISIGNHCGIEIDLGQSLRGWLYSF